MTGKTGHPGRPQKKNRRILFEVAVFIIPLFLVVTLVVNNLMTISAFSTYLSSAVVQNEVQMDDFFDGLNDYKAAAWLLDYWDSHDVIDAVHSEDYNYMSAYEQCYELFGTDTVRVEEKNLQSLTAEEQELFAVCCYVELYFQFAYMANESAMSNLLLIEINDDKDSGRVLFEISKDSDGTYRFGRTVDMETLKETWDKFELALSGNFRRWALRKPLRSDSFGYGITRPLETGGGSLILCAEVTGAEIYDTMWFVPYIRHNMIILLVVSLALILVFLYLIIIRPLSRVKRCIGLYGKNKDSEAVRTALSGIRLRNEIGVFADEFASLTEEMDRYTEEVAELAGEQERVVTELEVAKAIQKRMLPQDFPDRGEFSLFASMEPAREVGGDFYDFYLIDEDHLALTMADVSGKGIPASLLMAVSRTILKNRALMGGTPAEILEDANARLCEDNISDMFVTVWLGILTLSDGELVCANAGHENPCMRLGREAFSVKKTKHGLVLGAIGNVRYRNEQYRLEKGDALFLYTDGITEATASGNRLFTERRLEEVLRTAGGEESPRQILGIVRDAVADFVGDEPQFDDMTMMCLVYHGT